MTKLRVLLLFISTFVLVIPSQAQDFEIDDIIFSRDLTLTGLLPIQEDTVFPDTLEVVFAIIQVNDLEDGDEFDVVWLYEDDELNTSTYTHAIDGDEARIWTSWSEDGGLEDGDWAIEILYDGDVIAEEEFEVTNDEYIYPIRFGSNCSLGGATLVNEATEFEDITQLYAFVEFVNFDDEEVDVLWMWTIDDRDFELTVELELDGDNWQCFSLHNDGEPMTEGEYSLIVMDKDGDEYRESDEVAINE